MAIMPARTKGERGKHRGKTPADLKHELAGAGHYIARLKEQAAALQQQLDEAGIDYSGALEDRRAAEKRAAELARQLGTATAELLRVRRQLAPYLAAEANEQAVTVPPWERDTSDPADQATGPIDVSEIRDSHYDATATAWQAPPATTETTLRLRFTDGTVRQLHDRPNWATNNEEGVA